MIRWKCSHLLAEFRRLMAARERTQVICCTVQLNYNYLVIYCCTTKLNYSQLRHITLIVSYMEVSSDILIKNAAVMPRERSGDQSYDSSLVEFSWLVILGVFQMWLLITLVRYFKCFILGEFVRIHHFRESLPEALAEVHHSD